MAGVNKKQHPSGHGGSRSKKQRVDEQERAWCEMSEDDENKDDDEDDDGDDGDEPEDEEDPLDRRTKRIYADEEDGEEEDEQAHLQDGRGFSQLFANFKTVCIEVRPGLQPAGPKEKPKAYAKDDKPLSMTFPNENFSSVPENWADLMDILTDCDKDRPWVYPMDVALTFRRCTSRKIKTTPPMSGLAEWREHILPLLEDAEDGGYGDDNLPTVRLCILNVREHGIMTRLSDSEAKATAAGGKKEGIRAANAARQSDAHERNQDRRDTLHKLYPFMGRLYARFTGGRSGGGSAKTYMGLYAQCKHIITLRAELKGYMDWKLNESTPPTNPNGNLDFGNLPPPPNEILKEIWNYDVEARTRAPTRTQEAAIFREQVIEAARKEDAANAHAARGAGSRQPSRAGSPNGLLQDQQRQNSPGGGRMAPIELDEADSPAHTERHAREQSAQYPQMKPQPREREQQIHPTRPPPSLQELRQVPQAPEASLWHPSAPSSSIGLADRSAAADGTYNHGQAQLIQDITRQVMQQVMQQVTQQNMQQIMQHTQQVTQQVADLKQQVTLQVADLKQRMFGGEPASRPFDVCAENMGRHPRGGIAQLMPGDFSPLYTPAPTRGPTQHAPTPLPMQPLGDAQYPRTLRGTSYQQYDHPSAPSGGSRLEDTCAPSREVYSQPGVNSFSTLHRPAAYCRTQAPPPPAPARSSWPEHDQPSHWPVRSPAIAGQQGPTGMPPAQWSMGATPHTSGPNYASPTETHCHVSRPSHPAATASEALNTASNGVPPHSLPSASTSPRMSRTGQLSSACPGCAHRAAQPLSQSWQHHQRPEATNNDMLPAHPHPSRADELGPRRVRCYS